MKKIILFCLILFTSLKGISQVNLDQNGLKTTVININNTNAGFLRFKIADIGYNSFHWQSGGLVIIELFCQYYATGYEKYSLENGFLQGSNSGVPALKLVESYGIMHSGKINLGAASDLNTTAGDMVNRTLPVYLDLGPYSRYKVRLTYMQERVNLAENQNQISINSEPSGVEIPPFSLSNMLDNNLASSGNLMITGEGVNYIEKGNLGIGTITPKEKLSVNGKIRAHEIKVETNNWPDYVFAKEYHLPTLQETENHIKEKGHLPGIPSAAEVKANGIDLGEMNAKLLQKIEELTLHLIEMKKESSQDKINIKELKALTDLLFLEINKMKSKI